MTTEPVVHLFPREPRAEHRVGTMVRTGTFVGRKDGVEAGDLVGPEEEAEEKKE